MVPIYRLLTILVLSIVFATSATAGDFNVKIIHISVEGNDSNDGSAGRQKLGMHGPVRTFDRAKALVRALRSSSVAPLSIEVRIGSGRYELNRPLEFGPEDSGQVGLPVKYMPELGSRVYISGGTIVTNWFPDPIWGATAIFDPATFGGRCPSQVYVNGERRERPRLPATGTFKIGELLAPTAGTKSRYGGFLAKSGDIGESFRAGQDTEIVIFDAWTASRMRVIGFDHITSRLDLTGSFAGHGTKQDFSVGLPYYIENPLVDHLEPGTWGCDLASRRLRYQPLPSEIVQQINAVVPRLSQLLVVHGRKGFPVHDLAFDGITFEHSSWALPPTGWAAMQAEVGLSAAIELDNCHSISFDKITVTHTGASGIGVRRNCSDVLVKNSKLLDLGGGGISVGSAQRYPAAGSDWEGGSVGAAETYDINIQNNDIVGIGRIQRAAVGIWSGQAHHVNIEDNIIKDLYYSGISLGWVWNTGASLSHDNIVSKNTIENFGQGLLSDFGGIYTLGRQDRTIISGNYIKNGLSRSYAGHGLYADEGSAGISFIDNVVESTSQSAIHVHYGTNLLFSKNIVSDYGEAGIRCSRPSEGQSVVFDRNVLLSANIPSTFGYCSDPSYSFRSLISFKGDKVEIMDKQFGVSIFTVTQSPN